MTHSPFLPAALAEIAEMAGTGRHREHQAEELARLPRIEIGLTLAQLAAKIVSQLREDDLRGAAKTALRLAAAGACAAIEFRRRMKPMRRGDGGMSDRDSKRATEAARVIFSGRSTSNPADVMVTLEHTVATVLLALYQTPEMAAAMLNEGLVQGVEERLALCAAKTGAPK